MENPNQKEPTASDLLTYLDIATKFRNHEFNIQIFRNVIFTSAQTVMLACYAATVSKYSSASLAIALFGIVLSVFWFLYYRASLYWAWFWERRCRQVNDTVVEKLGLDVNIFAGHPSGSDDKPPPIRFAGKTITWIPVHTVLRWTQLAFGVLWLLLVVVACAAVVGC